MDSLLGTGLKKLLSETDPQVCPVTKLVSSLPEEEATLLDRVMKSNASTRQIHSELTASGFKIGRDTIANHRNGWCRCQGGNQ